MVAYGGVRERTWRTTLRRTDRKAILGSGRVVASLVKLCVRHCTGNPCVRGGTNKCVRASLQAHLFFSLGGSECGGFLFADHREALRFDVCLEVILKQFSLLPLRFLSFLVSAPQRSVLVQVVPRPGLCGGYSVCDDVGVCVESLKILK